MRSVERWALSEAIVTTNGRTDGHVAICKVAWKNIISERRREAAERVKQEEIARTRELERRREEAERRRAEQERREAEDRRRAEAARIQEGTRRFEEEEEAADDEYYDYYEYESTCPPGELTMQVT